MDGGAWWAAVHGVIEGRTRLSDFTFTFHFHALEKETANHSSVLAWRIPGTGEPRRLPSMGSQSRTRLKRLSSSSSSSSPLLPPGDISAIFPFHGGTIEAQDSRLKGAEQRWTQLIHLPAGPQIFSPAPPRNLGSSSPDHRPTDASLASRHESRAAK